MKKHEPKYIEVEGLMRACYDSFLKTGNKAYSEIIALADAVPAADVAEVRHGRWIVLGEQIENQTFDECKCSECGCVEYFNKGWKHFNYCPNCGADMRGEQNG